MEIDLKRTIRRWGVAFAGSMLAGLASGQATPDAAPSPCRFPTIPAEHIHARALLDDAMSYASPANKIVDPISGYPFEGWNQDPKRGLYLRSFTQLTAIGQWMELLANVAAGNADTPHLSRTRPRATDPPGQDTPGRPGRPEALGEGPARQLPRPRHRQATRAPGLERR